MLDLFAGTGALGIEAISRGAAYALFVDDGVEARALLRDNVETLGLGGVTRIFRRDATKLGPAHPLEPFSLVFLDPPYGKGLAEKALLSARDGGWLNAECADRRGGSGRCAAFKAPEGFRGARAARYDDTEFAFLRLDAERTYRLPEQPLDIGQLQFHIGRPAVIALAGIGHRLPSRAAARSFPRA